MNAPMLASDAANPQFVGAHNPDAALVVVFYTKPVHQPYLSSQEARPIFKDVDYIKIFTPGNQLNIIDTPVRAEHKRRFPVQWANYQNGKKGEQGIVGTPVSAWPFLTASQAEEFKAVKFFTVEQIANASDLQLQSLGMIGGANPHVIRDRAKAYLQAAAGTAEPQAQAAELSELKQQNAELQRQIAALSAAVNGMQSAQPAAQAKRGRKPKVVEDQAPPAPPAEEQPAAAQI